MKKTLLLLTAVAFAAGAFQFPAHAGLPATLADEKEAAAKTYEGTLETGIMAIGGETTGTIIKTKEGQFELDLKGDAALQKTAEGLNGKKVVVEGEYQPRPGVEVKERRIIVVKSIKAA